MIVDVLYVDGCPGHRRLLPALRRLSAEAGAELRERRVATAEQARAESFLGSPTVRVDGVDVEPGAAPRMDFALGCRLYRTPDGLSDLPAEEWIRGALGLGDAPLRGGQDSPSAEVRPDETGHGPGGDPRAQIALARGLVLEAVDCIRQASGLIDDVTSRAILSRQADELTRLAGGLGAPP